MPFTTPMAKVMGWEKCAQQMPGNLGAHPFEKLTWRLKSSRLIYNLAFPIYQFQGESSQPCSLNLSSVSTSPDAKSIS